jgi:spore coat polysaccharide biosynthesis protein SpsF
MLGRVIDRMRLIPGAVRLVVATSDQPDDDPIATFAAGEGVEVFRGSKDDVLGRAAACAEALRLDRIVRISCDSPFIDPQLVSRMLALHAEHDAELTTNVLPRTYPYGVSVEVLSVGLLDRLRTEASDQEDREHVTRLCYTQPDRFRITCHTMPDDRYSGLRLVVDTPEDYQLADAIIRQLGDKPEAASLEDIAAVARGIMSPA